MDTIKLKRATKSVANASTKVLEKDEVLVVTPDSGSGKGKCQLKFGDGITAAKSLPIAIDGENADEMKVSTIPTDSDENPVLSAGETVKVFFGKIKKKFTYLENLVGNVKSVTNLFGNTDAKTVAQGLQILVNTKLSKTDKYDGVDSTSTELWATANAVRKVNEKTDNNSTSIRELNSNLGEHFSEAERQIGTWMGKPLYRQCFHPTVDIAAGTQSYNISLGLSGVEVAMIDYAHTWCMGRSNTDVYCIPYVHNDAVNNVGAFLIVENADVKFAIRKGTNTSIRSIWITLTYTKTTDS
jgi:energy-coupling factor transporter ATP-binding protein EcfA2